MRVLPLNIGIVHFIGIGGIGMSGIAEILVTLGYEIQGSDIAENANIERLRRIGVTVMIGYNAENVKRSSFVVISSAIIAENDGTIEFGKELRGKLKVSIVTPEGTSSSYFIPKGKHINFNQGEKIKKGEYLLDGSPAPHDILRILGVEALTDYYVSEVQEDN